jgi:hypothetical protein
MFTTRAVNDQTNSTQQKLAVGPIEQKLFEKKSSERKLFEKNQAIRAKGFYTKSLEIYNRRQPIEQTTLGGMVVEQKPFEQKVLPWPPPLSFRPSSIGELRTRGRLGETVESFDSSVDLVFI